ncbi:MAG: hypothetical protein ACREF3_03145, partial [Acetobacteraceae bacterium]
TRDTRQLLGPPSRVIQSPRQQREIWEYPYFNAIQVPFTLNVQFSGDGIMRELITIRDATLDAGTYAN